MHFDSHEFIHINANIIREENALSLRVGNIKMIGAMKRNGRTEEIIIQSNEFYKLTICQSKWRKFKEKIKIWKYNLMLEKVNKYVTKVSWIKQKIHK